MSAERLEKGPVRPEEAERVREIDIREARVLVVIPTIKGREVLLRRAIKSIREEDLLVAGAIEVDTEGRGPAYCRNLAVLNKLNAGRSEEHTSELQSLMRISYAVFCLKKKRDKVEHTMY